MQNKCLVCGKQSLSYSRFCKECFYIQSELNKRIFGSVLFKVYTSCITALNSYKIRIELKRNKNKCIVIDCQNQRRVGADYCISCARRLELIRERAIVLQKEGLI